MNKKIYYTITGVFVTIILITILFNKGGYVLRNSKKDTFNNLGTISLMLETSANSGNYELSASDKWPTSGYVYNAELSGCENGSTLIYNEETNKVTLKANKSDKCYVYFDIIPPDISVSVNNLPETVGPLAQLNCSGATTTYNNKYNRIEVSELNSRGASCNLSYAIRTAKEYLNNKIISLSGTTQGNGRLVHETFIKGDFNDASPLSQSQYGAIAQFLTSYQSATSGTAVTNAYSYTNDEWVSNVSNMESGNFYNITFTISDNGVYQFCYNLSSGSTRNAMYFFEDGQASKRINGSNYIYASSTSSKNDCLDLGYINTNKSFRISQYVYTDISTLSFSIKKASNFKTIETGYRYEGQDPNNYVWFNNELWRIIGVMNSDSHGQSGLNLVKLIRNNSIGTLAWDKSRTVNWNTSSLKLLLNNEFLNSNNGTEGENCYEYSTTKKTKCDYRNIGIKNNYRDMIKKVKWFTSIVPNTSISAVEIYQKEKSDNTSTLEYIGLMYASDFGFAVLNENCSRLNGLNYYGGLECSKNNWLYNGEIEWTITPRSQVNAFSIEYSTNVTNGNSSIGLNVRPVLYLNELVYLIDGDGTITNPYIIGM